MRPVETHTLRAGVCTQAVLPCVAAALIHLGGCAAEVQVQSLATGRSDVSAHTLTGTDLHTLRHEAQRLCPLGGDILRQSGHLQAPQPTGSRWRTLLNGATQWMTPPQTSAQLVVLCNEPGEYARLPAVTAPVAAPARESARAPTGRTGGKTQPTAALPVGPITAEW